MDKICSFFGHRVIKSDDALRKELTCIVEKLILIEGFTLFYFGEFSEFDEMCYKIVTMLKGRYPYIKRFYCSVEREGCKKEAYSSILREKYEQIVYLPLAYDYWYSRIYYRNCEMINRSDYIVFYAEEREDSGAYKALKYAKKCKKTYINVFDLI